MDIKQRFEALTKKRDEAKAQQIQLNTKIDSAKDTIAEIENEWKEKYGINSFEEAKQMVLKMEAEITDTLDKCQEYLDQAGV